MTIERSNYRKITSVSALSAPIIVLYAFCRCFAIETSYKLMYMCLLVVFMCIILSPVQYISLYDGMILLVAIFMFANLDQEYGWRLYMYHVLACLCFFAYRRFGDYYVIMKTILLFSVLNFLVNIISLSFPSLYFSIAKMLLNPKAYEDAYTSFLRGNITGLSDHYSRNAYFCVAGIMVCIAMFFSNVRRKYLFLIIGIAETIMIMIIGKRAHFLFTIASVTVIYLLLGKSASQRIRNGLIIIIVLTVAFAIIYELIPKAFYVFERFTNIAPDTDLSTGRIALWKKCFKLFREAPILGMGYGYITTHFKTGISAWAGAHNDYIQWLCEEGIVGFILNIVPSIGLYYLSLKELRYEVRVGDFGGNLKQVVLIWSALFQTFILMYSMTGLPHFDAEINTIYYISLAVPLCYIDNVQGIKLRRIYIRSR